MSGAAMRSIAAARRAVEEAEAASHPPPDTLGPKGLLVDNLGHCSLLVASVAFLLAFLGAVVAGVMGPPIFSTASNPGAQLSASCSGANTASCNVTWTGTLTDMSPYHQVMWLDMKMARPQLAAPATGPALVGFPASWGLIYNIDLYAVQSDGTLVVLTQGATHVAPISFGAADTESGAAVLFATTEIRYPVFRLTVRFINAMGPFGALPNVNNNVQMFFTMSFVNKAYTAFEMGWKIFFTTTSVLLFLMYSGLLCW